jgi:hypothetical protein
LPPASIQFGGAAMLKSLPQVASGLQFGILIENIPNEAGRAFSPHDFVATVT